MRARIVMSAIALAAAMPLCAEPSARQAVVPTSPSSASELLRQQERLLGIAAAPIETRPGPHSESERRPAADTPARTGLPVARPRAAPAASMRTPLEMRIVLGVAGDGRPASGAAVSAAAPATAPAAQPPGAASAPLPSEPVPADAPGADASASGIVTVRLSAFETEYLTRRSRIAAGQHCQRFLIGADDIAFSRLDERHKRIALAGLLEEAASSRCLAAPR